MALTHNIDEALRLAAMSGNLIRLDELIAEKSSLPDFPQNLDSKNSFGNTPLHFAVENSKAEAIKRLIKAGADIDPHNIHGYTPLILALITHLNSPGYRHSLTLPIIKLLIDNKSNVNSCDVRGETPLHYAAKAEDIKPLIWLIEAKAYLNARNKNSGTPLHRAALEGYAENIRVLLNAGAEPNPRMKSLNMTPAEVAAMHGHFDALLALVQGGAELNELIVQIAKPNIQKQVEVLLEQQKLESVLNGKRNEDDQTSGNTLAL